MSKCIGCGIREATSWDGLWCRQCLGSEATSDDYPVRRQKTKNKWYQSKRATKVFTDKEEGYNVVQYHGCPVVKWNDNEIILDKCGWESHTTKDRMNQASREYGLGYQVYQKDFVWYVVYDNKTYEYNNDVFVIVKKKQKQELIVDGKGQFVFPDEWGVRKKWRPNYLDEL